MKIYGIDTFTIADVMAILENPKHAKLNKEAIERILKSQKNVREIVESERTVWDQHRLRATLRCKDF